MKKTIKRYIVFVRDNEGDQIGFEFKTKKDLKEFIKGIGDLEYTYTPKKVELISEQD